MYQSDQNDRRNSFEQDRQEKQQLPYGSTKNYSSQPITFSAFPAQVPADAVPQNNVDSNQNYNNMYGNNNNNYNNNNNNYNNNSGQGQRQQNIFLGHALNAVKRQDVPTINMTVSLAFLLIDPLMFVIFCQDYPQMQIFIQFWVFLIWLISSLIGMYGASKQSRWAIKVYRNSCIVFALVFLLMAIYYFVSVGKKEVYGTAEAFLIILGIFFIALFFWLLLAFEISLRQSQSVDWMKESETQEQISMHSGGIAGAANSNNNSGNRMKADLQQSLASNQDRFDYQ